MAEKPRSPLAMVLVLTLIATASGLALASISELTKGPIRESRLADLRANLERILPEHANQPSKDTKALCASGKTLSVYLAKDSSGSKVGAAFEVESRQGYGGLIRLLVGVDKKQHITGYYVLEHKETPGLGDKAAKDDPDCDQDFADQFKGKGLNNFRFLVRKDGGEVDAVTSATITSRAIGEALARGLRMYGKALEEEEARK